MMLCTMILWIGWRPHVKLTNVVYFNKISVCANELSKITEIFELVTKNHTKPFSNMTMTTFTFYSVKMERWELFKTFDSHLKNSSSFEHSWTQHTRISRCLLHWEDQQVSPITVLYERQTPTEGCVGFNITVDGRLQIVHLCCMMWYDP